METQWDEFSNQMNTNVSCRYVSLDDHHNRAAEQINCSGNILESRLKMFNTSIKIVKLQFSCLSSCSTALIEMVL